MPNLIIFRMLLRRFAGRRPWQSGYFFAAKRAGRKAAPVRQS